MFGKNLVTCAGLMVRFVLVCLLLMSLISLKQKGLVGQRGQSRCPVCFRFPASPQLFIELNLYLVRVW